jgi:hypothetical protein
VRQDQRADVGAVDVGVRHQDEMQDLVEAGHIYIAKPPLARLRLGAGRHATRLLVTRDDALKTRPGVPPKA